MIDKVKEENWIPKISNLKKLHAFLELFLHKNLGEDFKLIAPDFLVIAKKQDAKELVKLAQQIFYVLFFFSDRCSSLNLGDVTSSLPPETQELIANACNELHAQRASSISSSPAAANNSHDANMHHLRKLEELKEDHEREIERLKRDYDVMMEELKHNRNIMDENQAERKILLQKVKMFEESSALAADFSKAESLFKQEIDELRKSLSKAEEKRQEAEYIISKKDADLSSQESQLASLQLKCGQLEQLENKVRELKQTNDRLQRSDNTVSKYKKRLEDFEDIKKRLKESEEENFRQIQANSTLEEEVHKLNGFKVLVDSYKERMIELENKINTITIEKERKQIENRGLKETISILEIERDRYQEESMGYEAKLRDMELGQAPLSELMSSGETNLNEVQVQSYKTKIIKLEQELSAIRNGTRESGPTQRIIILESMLEDSKKARAKVEEELITAHRKNIMLDEELKRFQSDDPSDKLSYDLSLNLRVRLSETEEELSQCKRKLAEAQVALESCRNELLVAKSDLSMVGKDQLEAIALAKQELVRVTEALTDEKDSALQKCQELEGESKKQIQQINQLLMDKDALRTQSLQQKDMLLENERTIGDLKATLVALESRGPGTSANDLSEAQSCLAKETSRCMELREENIRLKGLEEKLSLQLKFLEEKIKASEKYGSRSLGLEEGIFQEASALKAELQNKENEVQRLKDQMKDIQSLHHRELTFMSSAWYDLGIKAQRDTSSGSTAANGRQLPASWLTKQRSNLNVQLKRR
ncbi:hypothetical protein DSO57_1032502 [Entomophthora muscae]|uniref:Uncharacterized protein n=1 Tax=Entomophthora muscae TaxID=34485 RepID=A0ACC2S294_9FUNG|nr:hypothetical protein DSO57_1032502 [Entomophthora muscae]